MECNYRLSFGGGDISQAVVRGSRVTCGNIWGTRMKFKTAYATQVPSPSSLPLAIKLYFILSVLEGSKTVTLYSKLKCMLHSYLCHLSLFGSKSQIHIIL